MFNNNLFSTLRFLQSDIPNSFNGKVLVVEQVIPRGNDPFVGKLLDINMLMMCPSGKERTSEGFRDLLAKSGFNMTRIVPTQGTVSVGEGIRV